MSQVKLIVSNWKMNLSFQESQKLIQGLLKIKTTKSKIKNIICPQFLLIPYVSDLIKGSDIIIGAQDCHFSENGAFTGDSSINLLLKLNCKYIIIGHSERRILHNEKNKLIRKKLDLIVSKNIHPIVCVGESIKERKKKNYLNVIKNQLKECIPFSMKNVIIAYEPIWSIGTGLTPTIEEISEIKKFTEDFLTQSKKVCKVNFLYGGSVNSINYSDVINNSNCNGALIGGSSLKLKEMKKILTSC